MLMLRSFRGQLITGVVLVQLVITPVLFSSILLYVQQGYQAQFIDNARAMSNLLVTQISKLDPEKDANALTSLLDDLMLGGQLSYVDIKGDNISLKPGTGQITPFEFQEDFFFAQHDDHVYFISLPLISDKETHGAQIRFGFDEAPVQEHIDTTYRRGATLALAYLVILVTIVGLLARRLTRSLDQLRDAANKISGGDTEKSLSIKTGIIEFASLARDLEQMRFALVRQNKMIQRREAFIRAVMNNMAEAMVIVDEDMEIDSVNSATETVFGYTESELIGEPIFNLFAKTDRKTLELFLREKLRADEDNDNLAENNEWDVVKKNGGTFVVEISLRKMVLDDQPVLICNLHDITFRKQTENALIQARHEAEDANRAKSMFLSTMSHELRTPLNAIIGYSEMLFDEAAEQQDENSKNDLTKIRSAGQHLLALINNVLDLSKIEAGKMEADMQTIEIGKIIADTANATKPLIEAKGNAFEISIDNDITFMVADETKLKQSIINLLSNASKFTEHGRISLHVSKIMKNNSPWIQFEVKDSGIGIPQDKLGQLFQNFSQVDATVASKYGGTGLGLSISRKFCQLMGGDITVSSQPNKGSTFTILLPADAKTTD